MVYLKIIEKGGEMNNRQNGFGAIEILLVVVGLLIIGAVAYVFFAQPFSKKDSTAQTSTVKDAGNTTADTATDEPAIDPNIAIKASATTYVEKAYVEYIQAVKADPGYAFSNHFVNYITDDFAKKMEGVAPFDTILCSKNNPTSFTYTAQTPANGTVVLDLKATDGSHPVVTYDSTQAKISNISCPDISS